MNWLVTIELKKAWSNILMLNEDIKAVGNRFFMLVVGRMGFRPDTKYLRRK